ncbi:MAG: hypothetical protein CVU22_25875 [Betaproteobacteria bacterium HGW-Betaproteobacteria-16]|nr:MAG: hypothetical protein CVU22_25875 [Betaproteobacteria bacterium HGW-Betaproteobacteria-16]
MKTKRTPGYEWDAIAGILAAVVAIVLHLLHVVDEHIVLPILLALLGLLFLNFMRHARSNEHTAEQVEGIALELSQLQQGLKPPEVVLVGPRQLRSVNEQFIRNMRGDSLWYNLCLSMYTPPPLFDALLRPALENPLVTSIQFVLDESQRELWQRVVEPQIAACVGHAKVREPRWRHLDKTSSFILADSQASGGTEALLSFWGEPFMAQSSTRDVPRFIFHVQKNSELLPHLVELQRNA